MDYAPAPSFRLLEAAYKAAEAQLGDVLARLQRARDTAEAALRLVTEARTVQATMVERAAGLDADVLRLEAAAARSPLVARMPKITAFLDRIHARPAYKRALDKGGPYELMK